jgi:hypothetical protein
VLEQTVRALEGKLVTARGQVGQQAAELEHAVNCIHQLKQENRYAAAGLPPRLHPTPAHFCSCAAVACVLFCVFPSAAKNGESKSAMIGKAWLMPFSPIERTCKYGLRVGVDTHAFMTRPCVSVEGRK